MQAIEPIQTQKTRKEYWVCYEHLGKRGIHAKQPVEELADAAALGCQRWLEKVNQQHGPMAQPYKIWIQYYEDGALVKMGEDLCAAKSSGAPKEKNTSLKASA
jgi:hypothetical protein